MLELNTTVIVSIERSEKRPLKRKAVVIGRTLEEHPRYDLRFLKDGSFEHNVPHTRVNPLNSPKNGG